MFGHCQGLLHVNYVGMEVAKISLHWLKIKTKTWNRFNTETWTIDYDMKQIPLKSTVRDYAQMLSRLSIKW